MFLCTDLLNTHFLRLQNQDIRKHHSVLYKLEYKLRLVCVMTSFTYTCHGMTTTTETA